MQLKTISCIIMSTILVTTLLMQTSTSLLYDNNNPKTHNAFAQQQSQLVPQHKTITSSLLSKKAFDVLLLSGRPVTNVINSSSQSTHVNQEQQQPTYPFAAGFLNACNSTNTISSLSKFENTTSLAKHSHDYQKGYYSALNNIKSCRDKKLIPSYLQIMQAHYVTPLSINKNSLLDFGIQLSSLLSSPLPNSFSMYENNQYGFKIQYPSDWKQFETLITPSMLEDNSRSPPTADHDAASFVSNNKTDSLSISRVEIIPMNTLLNYSYGGAHWAANKSKTPHDYVLDWIEYNNIGDHPKYYPVKNMPITVGVNHYPAWRVDYTYTEVHIDGSGENMYAVDVYTVIGDTVFKFQLTSDALVISNYLPIFQKMIDSFQLST